MRASPIVSVPVTSAPPEVSVVPAEQPESRKYRVRRLSWLALLLGIFVFLATNLSVAWQYFTAVSEPNIYDEYVRLVDHALGDPAWIAGRLTNAGGWPVKIVLGVIYHGLPVGAIIVALWQLRGLGRTRGSLLKGWPRHHLLRSFLVMGIVGPAIYLLFPVVGPLYAYRFGGGMELGNYWPHLVPDLNLTPGAHPFNDRTPRNCMPSLHTAWALAIFFHTRRAPGWLRWGGAVWLIVTLLATLGFGFHYGADLLAGAILAFAVESVLRVRLGKAPVLTLLAGLGFLLLTVLLLAYRFLSVTIATNPAIAGPVLLASVAGYLAACVVAWRATDARLAGRQLWRPVWRVSWRTQSVRQPLPARQLTEAKL